MPKLSNPDLPRVPRHGIANLVNQPSTIQVNYCRNPGCENYGVPPRTMPGDLGRSPNKDPNYKLHTTSGGRVPSLLCKTCKENPSIKSNRGIAEEIGRLVRTDGLWTLDERTACKTPECENFGRSVAHHPSEYTKRGFSSSGGQVYKCTWCRHTVVASTAFRIHADNQWHAADVFSRLANKAPMSGVVRGAGLGSSGNYYSILDFIHARCLAFSGALDRAMIDGRVRLPERMVIESDAQSYMLNWTSRLDRRNVEIYGYCSVDSHSRFILGMHGNFDTDADAFAINTEAAQLGDMSGREPFRKYARYWLAGDDLRAGRSKNFQTRSVRKGLVDQIEALYAAAASREDVEDIELEHLNVTYRTPFLRNGLLVHMPYTTYAHWYLLRRLLLGAGVEQTQFHFDIDSMSRAAFLCSFIKEIKERRAHAFYVKYDKNFTVDERRAAVAKARARRGKVRSELPAYKRRKVDLIMMKESLTAGHRHGKWHDEWFDHPNPTMNEPHKAMSWLTPDPALDEDTVARMFLRGRLARVDNVFMLTRRLFNAFERPIGTPSGQNAVWHGYQPYNPAMVQKYLTVFRTVNNFIQVGEDGRTPAMRLGLADGPLRYADILWPEQGRPPQRARRGRGPIVVGGLLTDLAQG